VTMPAGTSPTRVGDAPREGPVADQVGDRQVLQAQPVVVLTRAAGAGVQEVLPLVGHSGVDHSLTFICFPPVLGTLLSSRGAAIGRRSAASERAKARRGARRATRSRRPGPPPGAGEPEVDADEARLRSQLRARVASRRVIVGRLNGDEEDHPAPAERHGDLADPSPRASGAGSQQPRGPGVLAHGHGAEDGQRDRPGLRPPDGDARRPACETLLRSRTTRHTGPSSGSPGTRPVSWFPWPCLRG